MSTLAQVNADLHGGEFIYRHYGATLDDYIRIANEDTRLELIDGVLIMHSPASIRHEDVFAFLLTLVREFATTSRQGRAFGSRVAVVLDDDRRVEPDLIFLKNEHLNRIGEVFVNGPVDWIVEILSPATREHDLGDKRRIYADAGIPELWFIDYTHEQVLIDRPAGSRVAEIHTGRVTCTALPGFWIEADWLWRTPLPNALDCLKQITPD